jgi:hypothetical protein
LTVADFCAEVKGTQKLYVETGNAVNSISETWGGVTIARKMFAFCWKFKH